MFKGVDFGLGSIYAVRTGQWKGYPLDLAKRKQMRTQLAFWPNQPSHYLISQRIVDTQRKGRDGEPYEDYHLLYPASKADLQIKHIEFVKGVWQDRVKAETIEERANA